MQQIEKMENWRQIKTELADREGHLYTFTDKARTLMFEGRYSDIILYNSKDFTDTKFYFNKLVLASLSGYFAALFFIQPDQKYIGIPGGLYRALISNILVSMGQSVWLSKDDHKRFLQAKQKYKFSSDILISDGNGGNDANEVIGNPVKPAEEREICTERAFHNLLSSMALHKSSSEPIRTSEPELENIIPSQTSDTLHLKGIIANSGKDDAQINSMPLHESYSEVGADPNLNKTAETQLPTLENIIPVPSSFTEQFETEVISTLDKFGTLPFTPFNGFNEELLEANDDLNSSKKNTYLDEVLPFQNNNKDEPDCENLKLIQSNMATSSLDANSESINILEQMNTQSSSHITNPRSNINTNVSIGSSSSPLEEVPIEKYIHKVDVLKKIFKTPNKKIPTCKLPKKRIRGSKKRCHHCKKLIIHDNLGRHLALCHFCQPCSLEFSCRLKLQAHCIEHHSQDSRFVCQLCNRIYNSSYMNQHRRQCVVKLSDNYSYKSKSPTI